MRKNLTALICFICILSLTLPLLVSCGDRKKNGDTSDETPAEEDEWGEEMGRPVLGKFINCEDVQPSAAKTTANNKGMSGLRSSVHLHGTASKDSWLSDTPESVIYDLGFVQRVGYMYIWNCNVKDKLDCGFKEVTVEYSTDGENYLPLRSGKYTLSRALEEENELYGGNAANNLDDGSRTPVSFRGENARFVKITPVSNYGGEKYGLSEVRFFSYKTRPSVGERICAFAYTPSRESGAGNLVNGFVFDEEGKVMSDKSRMWYTSAEKPEEAFIIIDLDGSFPVDHITVYNYNDPADFASGIKTFDIEYSVASPCDIDGKTLNYDKGEWQTLKKNVKLDISAEQGCAFVDIDFKGKNAQYVKITPRSNHGGSLLGLSAVNIYAAAGMASSPDYEWTGLLSCEGSFPYQQSVVNGRKGTGWLLADGIFSVNLNGANAPGGALEDSRTMFIFSDTMYGTFKDYPDGKYGVYGKIIDLQGSVNHSFAYLIGNKPDPRNLRVYLHNGKNANGNIATYRDWLTGLTMVGNCAYTWGMRFNASWGADSMDFIKVKLDENLDINIKTQPKVTTNAKMLLNKDGHDYMFGTAVLNNTAEAASTPDPDGYIYIYGYRSGWLSKKPIVARATPETFEDEERWEFWNGKEWKNGIENTEILGDVEVSAEYSVHYVTEGMYAGKYVMCYTEGTNTGKLCISVSDKPYTGFDKSTIVYYCNDRCELFDSTGDNGVYTYNAKAQVHFAPTGEILMTYNVNTYNFDSNRSALEYLYPHWVAIYEIKG